MIYVYYGFLITSKLVCSEILYHAELVSISVLLLIHCKILLIITTSAKAAELHR